MTDERHKNGFEKGEMGAPPCDVASAGRINSKGQSCLYLSNNMDTTVKEIRGQAFDGVTIAKYLGYDGVKYYSTFDKESYNLALFNPNACECVECENYIINNLDYHLIRN